MTKFFFVDRNNLSNFKSAWDFSQGKRFINNNFQWDRDNIFQNFQNPYRNAVRTN